MILGGSMISIFPSQMYGELGGAPKMVPFLTYWTFLSSVLPSEGSWIVQTTFICLLMMSSKGFCWGIILGCTRTVQHCTHSGPERHFWQKSCFLAVFDDVFTRYRVLRSYLRFPRVYNTCWEYLGGYRGCLG